MSLLWRWRSLRLCYRWNWRLPPLRRRSTERRRLRGMFEEGGAEEDEEEDEDEEEGNLKHRNDRERFCRRRCVPE